MKHSRRFLALLMCLLLAFGPTGAVFAEDPTPAEISAEPAPAAELAQEPVAAPDPTQEPAAAPDPADAPATAPDPIEEPGEATDGPAAAEQPAEEPETTVIPELPDEPDAPQHTEEPASEPSVDFTRDASFSPEFTLGYAELVGESLAYASPAPNADTVLSLRQGIVYVLSRSATSQADRLEAAFDDGKGERIVWIDASRLRPLSPEETEVFVRIRAAAEGTRFLNSAAELPLDAVAYVSAVTYELTPEDESAPVESTPAMLVSQTQFTLGKGEKATIPVSFTDGGSHAVTYVSADASIATVSADGQITGKKVGETDIELSCELGNSVKVHVSVKSAPSKVKLSAPRKTLGVNEQIQLTATIADSAASKLSFSTSKASVAAVDAKGFVTTFATGTATITVKTFNGKKASVKLTVKPAPTSVALSETKLDMGIGQTSKLTVTLSKGSASACTFESSNPDVLKVDSATGSMTAQATGTATLTVRTHNGKTATCDVTVKPAPSKISFAQTEMVIGVGEKLEIPAVTLGEANENCAGSYTIASSNKKIAKITGQNIKGVKKGSATITVTTYNDKTATLKVTVKKAPTKVKLSASHKTLGVDEQLALTHTFTPSTASSELTYTSNNTAVATVDANGVVTAHAIGTAKITAKTFNKKKSSVTLTVVAKPTGITLPASLAMGVSEKYTVKPTLTPAGSGGGLTFSVDDTGVATVNASTGAITAKAKGSTTLRVKTYNGLTASCALTVKDAPTGINLQESSFTMSKGDTYQLLTPVLTGTDVASAGITYSSSAKKYAKVSASGVITAVKAGKAKITAKTYNGKKATITVTVKAAPKSISFSESSHKLYIGLAFTPEVKFANGVAGSYTLTSSNSSVASISGNTVQGVAAGTATITATSFNGKTATMTVTVPALPDSVTLSPASLTLGAGDSGTVTATMPSGQGAALTYVSDNIGVASVTVVDNEKITVKAVAPGSATITVTSHNGKTSTAKITVVKAPTALSVSPSRAGRSLDEKQLQLSVGFGSDGEGGRVSYTSSDTTIAKVNGSGLVTFVKVGTVKITAKTYNGHSAVCELTIGEKPTKMSFAQSEYSVALGDTVQLPASFDKGCESYTLSAADSSVAAISGDTVRGDKLGSTTVTATSRSGLQASCTVKVVEAPTGIQLDVTKAELVMGNTNTLQLHATPLPNGVGSVRYSSSNPAVAIVDYATGLVTAVNSGDCVIRATTYDGKYTAECAIHVLNILAGVKIGIDPGHQAQANMGMESSSPSGGHSKYKVAAGTHGVSTKIKEYKTNLTVALQLRDALVALGAEVVMTRETHNVNISNKQRAVLMNDNNVDLALRIHCNSASSSSTKGLEIWSRKSSAYSNSVVNGKTLLANEKAAAKAIEKHFKAATGCTSRGIKLDNTYTMNNWCKMPCLLIEMGFMSNASEDKKLNDPEYQKKMVKGMVNGICEYMGRDLPNW